MSQTYREPSHPVHPLFVNRWSRRAFSGEGISREQLYSLFEAARWAPSANNAQPWRFIYALNGTVEWAQLHQLLNENNQRWSAKAAALVILVSKTVHLRRDATEASPLRSHSLDSGAAWASLAFQAELSGWRTHAIGGFDRERARQSLEIPPEFQVEVAIAIGRQADPVTLPDDMRAREVPNQRRPLHEIVAHGRFNFSA